MSEAESKVAGLQEDLKAEKKLCSDAESATVDLEQAAATAAEKLKVLTTAHEEEKAALVKCAEDAEGRLKPVSEELTGLKLHINHMTHAIFGKSPSNFSDESPMYFFHVCSNANLYLCSKTRRQKKWKP